MTTIIIRFLTATIIPDCVTYDALGVVTSTTKFIVNFESNIESIFINGFESTLGTSLPHRSILPCEGKNFILVTGADRLNCKLYKGTNPAPT